MKIQESELIINPDGSIYHVHLRPEELADDVILVGDPARVPVVSGHFDTVELRRENREIHSHTGTYKGRRITVMVHRYGAGQYRHSHKRTRRS